MQLTRRNILSALSILFWSAETQELVGCVRF